MAITETGEVVLGGETTGDFPTTPGALKTSFAGGGHFGVDAFLARLDVTLTGSAQLTWATYLGGPGDDAVMDLAVEPSGLVTAVGLAGGNPPLVRPLPWTTPGALQPNFQGGGQPPVGPTDGFVVRLDPSQSGNAQLVYGTFLGGSQGQENAMDVALTPTGGAVVVGWTWSANFPATGINQGNSEVFVAELDMLPAGVTRFGSGYGYASVNSMPAAGNTGFEVGWTHNHQSLGIGTAPGGWLVFGSPSPVGTPLPGLPGITLFLAIPVVAVVQPSSTWGSGFRFALPIPSWIPTGASIACQWAMLYPPPGCHPTWPPMCAPPMLGVSDALEIVVQ
jgi:hypothetical protein